MPVPTAPGTTDYEMTSDVDMQYTRVFAAPRQLVFDAWSNDKHVVNWMGMREQTMKVPQHDFRVGGQYRWEWYTAEGEHQVTVRGEFLEIVPNELIRNTEIMEFGEMVTPETNCGLHFTESRGLTTVVATVHFPNAETASAAMQSGMQTGIDIGFDRLDDLLAAQS
jgi:uncharacterized protein YndB with AHSA1/START domain